MQFAYKQTDQQADGHGYIHSARLVDHLCVHRRLLLGFLRGKFTIPCSGYTNLFSSSLQYINHSVSVIVKLH